jgi:hypothetical protein
MSVEDNQSERVGVWWQVKGVRVVTEQRSTVLGGPGGQALVRNTSVLE